MLLHAAQQCPVLLMLRDSINRSILLKAHWAGLTPEVNVHMLTTHTMSPCHLHSFSFPENQRKGSYTSTIATTSLSPLYAIVQSLRQSELKEKSAMRKGTMDTSVMFSGSEKPNSVQQADKYRNGKNTVILKSNSSGSICSGDWQHCAN